MLKQISAKVDPKAYEHLKKMGEKEDRKFNYMLNRLLIERMEKDLKKKKK